MRKDPDHLPRDSRPALVSFVDGEELFVSTHATQESGWLWVELWDGTRRTIPPQRVAYVESVETSSQRQDGTAWREIADDELRERARQAAGLDDGRQRAVAGGGRA